MKFVPQPVLAHQVAAAITAAKPIYPFIRTPSINVYPGATTIAPTLFTVLIIFSSLAQLLTLVLQSLFFQPDISTSALSNKNCNPKQSCKHSKASAISGLSWQTFTKPKPKHGHLAPVETKPGLTAIPSKTSCSNSPQPQSCFFPPNFTSTATLKSVVLLLFSNTIGGGGGGVNLNERQVFKH